MDPEVISALIESGTTLATLIGSGTVTAITAKIQGLKSEKSVDKIRSSYDEIIQQILQERSDAIILAQMYKSELDKVSISDKDIEHLQKTIEKVLLIFMGMQTVGIDQKDKEALEKIKSQQESLYALKELVNADTLKTMQLLGFNYKAAIGEPLTEICSEAIRNFAKSKTKLPQNSSQKRK